MSGGPAPGPAELRAILEWYAAVGVDGVLEEEPVDRLAPRPPAEDASADLPLNAEPAGDAAPNDRADPLSAAGQAPAGDFVAFRGELPPPALPRGATTGSATPVAAPVEETERAARAAAAAATNLDELRDALARFEGCNLRLTATNLVFADGTPGSRVMLVGEAPGREEDREGLPFVGRSGQLLDRMLAAIGLDRKAVYIANVVPWRPPGNRTPTPQETAACRPFIARQIELADPDFLICLGGAAAHELFATAEGILRMRGKWRTYDTGRRSIRAMAMLHPAYLLRQPLHKRLAWRDLMTLRTALREAGAAPGS